MHSLEIRYRHSREYRNEDGIDNEIETMANIHRKDI